MLSLTYSHIVSLVPFFSVAGMQVANIRRLKHPISHRLSFPLSLSLSYLNHKIKFTRRDEIRQHLHSSIF